MRRDCECLIHFFLLKHYTLGKAMGFLAITYSALGRHQEAVVMMEKTLEFQRRVLPDTHPQIGVT